MTTVLVTGASAGLGAAFARELARTGHDVVLVARTPDRLAQTAARLEAAYGVRTEVLAADLADPADVRRVADRVAGDGPLGSVDLLVNNAGFGLSTGFLDASIEDELRLFDVMCRATLVLSHAAARAMSARGYGGILVVSSVASFVAMGTYSAAKAWEATFAESLAVELAPHGVAVSAVCPGFTHTEFHERAAMDMSRLPEALWLDADDVVRDALAALRDRRPICVPGLPYRALVAGLGLAPRGLVSRVSTALAARRR